MDVKPGGRMTVVVVGMVVDVVVCVVVVVVGGLVGIIQTGSTALSTLHLV